MEDHKHNEHLNNLTEIRSLMDQASRFISLSGLTGVFIGIFALLGAFAAYWHFGYQYYTNDFYDQILDCRGWPRWDFLVFLFVDGSLDLREAEAYCEE